MKGIQTMECTQCSKRLKGVADTDVVCPVCNAPNRFPAEPQPDEPAAGGWKELPPDEEPRVVVRKKR